MDNTLSNIVLSLHDVSFAYRKRKGLFQTTPHTVLDNISFDIFAGETLGVLGRNGAGKSTLLQMLAGITKPNSGTIDARVNSVSLLTLNLGFVFPLTGRQNGVLSCMLSGMSRATAERMQDNILKFSELGDSFEQPLNTYSAGMKARLGFSVAMEVDPDILLIDEVLGVGDIQFKEKSSERIKARLKSNKTALLVTHNLSEIVESCNRAVWIESGKVKAVGDAVDVTSEYKEYFS